MAAAKTMEDYKKDYEAAKAAGRKAANYGDASAGRQAAAAGSGVTPPRNGRPGRYLIDQVERPVKDGGSGSADHGRHSHRGSSGGGKDVSGAVDSGTVDGGTADGGDMDSGTAESKDVDGNADAGGTDLSGIGVSIGGAGSANRLTVPNDPNLSGQVQDYSAYLEQMYAAKLDAALAELDAAYQSNLYSLDQAEQAISDQYQTARSNTAGASELAKRNFAEYAAASGLNSGTGGQAELARNVTLQNNWNAINAAEADAISDLELQRAEAEAQYNSAIAQAKAEGDYELASALYQEKVRVQNAMIDAEIQEYQNAVTKYKLNYQAQSDQAGGAQQDRLVYQTASGQTDGGAQEDPQASQPPADQADDSQQEHQTQQDAAGGRQWADETVSRKKRREDSRTRRQDAGGQRRDFWNRGYGGQSAALAEYGHAFLSQGIMPSADMLAAMGITEADARSYLARGQSRAD